MVDDLEPAPITEQENDRRWLVCCAVNEFNSNDGQTPKSTNLEDFYRCPWFSMG